MRLLLDTCTFLWLVGDVERLSGNATAMIRDADNDCRLSAVSLWEALVKHAAGRLEIACEPEPVGAFLHVTQGHGECLLPARLRTPAGEAPVAARGRERR
jgi:PIN domain nuclease of toxin-antitoxin system